MEAEPNQFKRWLILINVALSVFMATLDSSIVNIALPVISRELSVNISSIQWVVTSYLLTISILLLIWGKISDIYGRKKVFAAGFIIFTAGSLMCGISSSLGMLVFSRVLQAIGASSMMALSQGIVTTTFPPAERGKALGITGTTVAIGSLVGPSLGGVLVNISGWQLIFFINLPIGIIGTVLTFLLIPEDVPDEKPSGFDLKGSAMFTASLLLLFLSLLLFQEGGIPAELFLPMLVVSLVLLVLFIRYEGQQTNPLMNLGLFRNPEFSLGITSAFLSFVAIFSTLVFIPFYLQNVLNLDTLKAGLIMSFYPGVTALVAPVSGWLSDRITYRPLTVSGLFISTVVYIILSNLGPSSSHIRIIVLMAFLGFGMALFQSPNNSSVMGAAPRTQLGVAGGINALFRNLGMVTGITLSVILFTMSTRMNINNMTQAGAPFDASLFLKGFRVIMLSAALMCLAALAVSVSRLKLTNRT